MPDDHAGKGTTAGKTGFTGDDVPAPGSQESPKTGQSKRAVNKKPYKKKKKVSQDKQKTDGKTPDKKYYPKKFREKAYEVSSGEVSSGEVSSDDDTNRFTSGQGEQSQNGTETVTAGRHDQSVSPKASDGNDKGLSHADALVTESAHTESAHDELRPGFDDREVNVPKDADPKNALSKDADPKDVLSKDADPKDALSKYADPKDAISKDADPKDVSSRDALSKDADPKGSDLENQGMPEDDNGDDDHDSVHDNFRDRYESPEIYDERDEGYPPRYKGEIPHPVSEEAVRVGKDTLQKMVSFITDGAIVVAETDEDRLLLRVEGGISGVLIGRRGQTLEAMQYITDKIINRSSESRVRLKVDIEGYMETRKANLQTLAYKMADKARKTGRPATINQMTAQDRRIVHLTLKDDYRVRTQSMGEGYYRRLVIFPKRGTWKRKTSYRNS
ncbi:MAG: KH domain-containing protein [Desulfamplus sp.]|nr:KH domain-containing protein [Desulfamplus sp.]